MFIIENEILKLTILPKGAELTSIYHKERRLEYMWNADPAWWGKHSPVLFPIVGTLKNNSYFYNGKPYQLPRHGFARDMLFDVEERKTEFITFLLHANDKSLKIFPFFFEFRIKYAFKKSILWVTYEVKNTGKEEMYFSVGGHPAFKVPLIDGTSYDDYWLEFDQEENAGCWPISEEGLIENAPIPFLKNTNKLSLTKELFQKDALVFKQLRSSSVALKSDKTDHGFKFSFSGFPYLGIWAAKGADFVCIEPWCGIADSVDSDQQLMNKEGINKLSTGESFSRTWKLEIF